MKCLNDRAPCCLDFWWRVPYGDGGNHLSSAAVVSGLLLFVKFSPEFSPTQKLHYYNYDANPESKALDHQHLQAHHQHMAPPRGRKKSQGRKKIEMKLIADENARTVTFSKRRAGLFKKATELSILCGTQIALIVFSLGGRAYSFGHPDVESVIGRFRNRNPMPNPQDSVHGMRIHATMLQQLKEQCDEKNQELETTKRRGKEIEEALEGSSYQITEERLNTLNLHQLKQLKEKMEKLREQVRLLVNGSPQADAAGPSNSMNVVTEPAIPGEADLANVERDEREESPIPPDWLKL